LAVTCVYVVGTVVFYAQCIPSCPAGRRRPPPPAVLVFYPSTPTATYTLSLHDALPIFGRVLHEDRGDDVLHILEPDRLEHAHRADRKSTRLNSSHVKSSYAVFGWKKKRRQGDRPGTAHPTMTYHGEKAMTDMPGEPCVK